MLSTNTPRPVMNYDFYDYYEYHGNTVIERIRRKAGKIIRRDWIIFDTVNEAAEFINEWAN